jgi:hypothetical protein
MSIAKRADLLPVWTVEKGVSGYYGPNSLVFYQKSPEVAGYAYRAKSTYISSNIPPDEDSNWAIDYTYSNKWVASGKYKFGSRVYHFNGQYTYAYVASTRYFGGSGKPNEEVDDDGIRTWELEESYYGPSYGYNYAGGLPTFLFPVRKVGGYLGGERAWPYNPLYPEERFEGRYYYQYSGGSDNYTPINVRLDYYLHRENIQKKDYSDWNSKYQSYAYDNRTYNFREDKMDSNYEFPHRKKGIHFAKWRKMTATGNWTETYQNPYKFGESQYVFTLRYGYYFNTQFVDYFDVHGFSIEMWPHIGNDEFSLVPSTTNDYNSYWWNYSSGINYSPFTRFGGDGGYDTNGLSLTGGWSDPDGGQKENAGPSDEECKTSAGFIRFSPAFSDLNCTYYFNVETQKLKWEPYEMYYLDENGQAVFWKYGYNLQQDGEISTEFIKHSATTRDIDFRCTDTVGSQGPPYIAQINRQHLVVSTQGGNEINFSSYKKPMTTVGIGFAGWKIS